MFTDEMHRNGIFMLPIRKEALQCADISIENVTKLVGRFDAVDSLYLKNI